MHCRSISSFIVLWLASVGASLGAAFPGFATAVDQGVANNSVYDFVVVGGGISGLTVASRLTENPSVSVLVLETGPFDQNEDSVKVPGLLNITSYAYPDFISAPQTALQNQTYPVLAGRAVGGGSIINGLLWFRSSHAEYDAWEQLGGSGWGWTDLLPYFIKSETSTPAQPAFADAANITYDSAVHGTDGPVQVSYPDFYYPVSGNWWEASLSLDLCPVLDLNSGNTSGISFTTTSVDPKMRTRSDARLAYYAAKERARPNFHILVNHTASKILHTGNRSTGVAYQSSSGGPTRNVLAKKEVLVAAGGAHTPQLLQLSGIGPAKLLKKLGIQIIADLPGVGSNLQDTPNFFVPYEFTNDEYPNEQTFATNNTFDAEQLALYNSSRKGAFVLTAGYSTNLAMLPLSNITSHYSKIIANARQANPIAHLPAGTDETVAAGYKTQRELRLSILGGQDVISAFMQWTTGNGVQLFLGSVFSRGSINVNSTNIFDRPIVDWRSMTDPLDFQIMEATVRKNRDIMQAKAMQPLNGTEVAPFGNNIQSSAAIRESLISVANPSLAHVCCTAPMMKKEYGGVVDAQKKVYGMEGLRVIDISTFPVLTTLPPQAAVYASAEKIADLIKDEWKL